MDFQTQIELPVGLPPITHAEQILMMGSCFAQNIGTINERRRVSIRSESFWYPFTTLLRLSAVLIEILEKEKYIRRVTCFP